MVMDLLAIKITDTVAATTDMITTAAVAMAIEAAERVPVNAVDVAATPMVQRPAAKKIAQVAFAEAVAPEDRSVTVAKKEDKVNAVWFTAEAKDI